MDTIQNPILREDTERAQFEYNMRILRENAETVTMTLKRYEEMQEMIDDLKNQNINLSDELLHEIKNNPNYEPIENVYSFFIGTQRFSLKKGINEQIDSLQYEIELLKRKLNRKLTFWEKLKNLFKD